MDEFVDPRKTHFVELKSRGELPHLYKEGGSYFVTFRLFDAVTPRRKAVYVPRAGGTPAPQNQAGETPGPQSVARGGNRQGWTPDLDVAAIAEASEIPLRLGSCLLARPEIAALTESALRHFQDDRYHLAAWCVMPNHVHAIFTPTNGWEPASILHSWKSFTAHQTNKLLRRRGTLWERESFDHLIRNVGHFDAFIRYVEDNPVKAGLCKAPEEWPWSSARFRSGGP